jgi:hypothetical protein
MTIQLTDDFHLQAKAMVMISFKRIITKAKQIEYKAHSHYTAKLQERAFLLLKSIIIVRQSLRQGHRLLSGKISNMLKHRAMQRFRTALSHHNYLSASSRLIKKKTDILYKKKYTSRIHEFI